MHPHDKHKILDWILIYLYVVTGEIAKYHKSLP